MMEQQNMTEIAIKKFNGRIPITGTLFDVLKNEDLVLLRRKQEEVYIMKREKL